MVCSPGGTAGFKGLSQVIESEFRWGALETDDGPSLVLVHGSGMSASTWAPLMPYLGTRRLIAFDLPGFGGGVRDRPRAAKT